MPVVTVISLLISIAAVGIAAHTKIQQRESRELRGLAQKLKSIHEGSERIYLELRNQRKHIDLEGNFEDIAKEVLACRHDTGSEKVEIFVSFDKIVRLEDEFDKEKINDAKKLAKKYKSSQPIQMRVKVGSRKEMYATGRNISVHNPIKYVGSIHDEIDGIEKQYGEKLEEFDGNLLNEVRSIINTILENISKHHLKYNDSFVIDLNEYETTEEIEDSAFEKLFRYDGIEEDLDEVEELTEEIEELRKGTLQASYS